MTKHIADLRVAGKVALCAGAVLALLFIVAAVAAFGLGSTQWNFDDYRKTAQRASAATHLQSSLLSASIAVKDFMLSSSATAQDEVGSAATDGLGGAGRVVHAGHEDDGRDGKPLADQAVKLVAVHVRQADVTQDDVVADGASHRQRFLTVLGGVDLTAGTT